MEKIVYNIEINGPHVKFYAGVNGRQMTRLEAAYHLQKLTTSLLRDGMKEKGMLLPEDSSLLVVS